MEGPLENRARQLLEANITNIELISYFRRSTLKTPIFLSVINRKYPEIKALVYNGLINDIAPVKSYIFHLDKFSNHFYSLYQQKIDDMKDDIWRRKRKKNDIIQLTEEMEPDENSEDFELQLQKVLEFARNSIGELDGMEIEKEDMNKEIGILQEQMEGDPYHRFLMLIQSDRDIIYNKRTEDNDSIIHKKILNYLNDSTGGKGWQKMTELKNKGFFKEFSPAKNYYITELGLSVDCLLKRSVWQQEDVYEKTAEESAQEEEFNRMKEIFGF